jgi:hypothetical protein
MNDGKLKSRPPTSAVASAEEFISGAGTQTRREAEPSPTSSAQEKEAKAERYPWEAPEVRQDVNKVFNLRLPEPYLLKLKYIAEHTPDSMQQFCLDVLLPAIDAKIEELTGATRTEA